jgi:hypothetical protein
MPGEASPALLLLIAVGVPASVVAWLIAARRRGALGV